MTQVTEIQTIQDGVIIELPFKGYAHTFIKSGKISYSQCTSLEEYKHKENNQNLVFVSWEDFHEMHRELYTVPFTEITEESYENMLNCLPPMQWHDLSPRFNIFLCSEAMSAQFHGAYVYDRENKKYYSGQIDRFMSDENVLKMLSHI